jgi:2-polyprenyl-3-methyl-5-hydroxy-6-metoxy-1,4-benzoquinol methylase
MKLSQCAKRGETQKFYEANARAYFDSTIAIDVSELRERFLKYVPPSGRILDAGSGSGRDTLAFLQRGYIVEAFDASRTLVEISSELTGVPTRVLRFEEFEEAAKYDGIWACASLLHVQMGDLPRVLERLHGALKPDGALYVSFKRGIGESITQDGRRFTNLTLHALRELLAKIAGLKVVEVWTSGGEGSSKGDEEWVNAIAVKRSQ